MNKHTVPHIDSNIDDEFVGDDVVAVRRDDEPEDNESSTSHDVIAISATTSSEMDDDDDEDDEEDDDSTVTATTPPLQEVTRVETSVARTKAPKSTAARGQLSCADCKSFYRTEEELGRHKVVVHPPSAKTTPGIVCCPHCSRKFQPGNRIDHHLWKMHAIATINRSMCTKCTKTFPPIAIYYRRMAEHMRLVHDDAQDEHGYTFELLARRAADFRARFDGITEAGVIKRLGLPPPVFAKKNVVKTPRPTAAKTKASAAAASATSTESTATATSATSIASTATASTASTTGTTATASIASTATASTAASTASTAAASTASTAAVGPHGRESTGEPQLDALAAAVQTMIPDADLTIVDHIRDQLAQEDRRHQDALRQVEQYIAQEHVKMEAEAAEARDVLAAEHRDKRRRCMDPLREIFAAASAKSK